MSDTALRLMYEEPPATQAVHGHGDRRLMPSDLYAAARRIIDRYGMEELSWLDAGNGVSCYALLRLRFKSMEQFDRVIDRVAEAIQAEGLLPLKQAHRGP